MDTDELDWNPDPKLWDLYKLDCADKLLQPSVKDFYLWLAEEDYDQ